MTTEHEYQQCQRHIFLTETLQHRSYQKHALDVHPCSEGSTLFPVGRRGGGMFFLNKYFISDFDKHFFLIWSRQKKVTICGEIK